MFDYSKPSSVQAVIAGLSVERMAPYMKAASGDAAKALRLYEENTARSTALYAQLQTFEVLLRNAFDRELSAPFITMKPASHFLPGNPRILWIEHPVMPRTDLRPYANRSSLWTVTRRKRPNSGLF